MSEAPERIWAVEGLSEVLSFNSYDQGGQEYIRADLYTAQQAEIARLREALERIDKHEITRKTTMIERLQNIAHIARTALNKGPDGPVLSRPDHSPESVGRDEASGGGFND